MYKKKHSYRKLAERQFSNLILQALQDPDKIKEEVSFWSAYDGPQSAGLIKSFQNALRSAECLKEDFKSFGKTINLSRYAPYVKEIKQELFSPLQSSLF